MSFFIFHSTVTPRGGSVFYSSLLVPIQLCSMTKIQCKNRSVNIIYDIQTKWITMEAFRKGAVRMVEEDDSVKRLERRRGLLSLPYSPVLQFPCCDRVDGNGIVTFGSIPLVQNVQKKNKNPTTTTTKEREKRKGRQNGKRKCERVDATAQNSNADKPPLKEK